jgi:hypothetical protein
VLSSYLYAIQTDELAVDGVQADCAEFAKTVFAATFYNTEISTLEKIIKGKDKMQILIDSYWEAVLKKKPISKPQDVSSCQGIPYPSETITGLLGR